jgi:putative DNA primase/helicase
VQKLDILKSLSGNDTVAASFKFQDTFAFDNKALLAFACNSLPKIEDIGEFQSFASRMIIYPFTRVIERKDWDLKLQEKLRADITGFLNFAINGLRQLGADEYIINESESMLQAKADYAGATESFSGFCDKYIKRDSGSAITSTDIKNAYHHYCHINDYVELKDNQWSGLLQRAFGAIRATKTVHQNGIERRVRAYRGVDFKKSLSELLDEQPPDDAVAISNIFENKE